MKKIFHRAIHWVYQFVIGLILLFIAVLSGLYFTSANFEKYRSNFESFASKAINQPVIVGSISIGVKGLEPVLRLQNIEIFNESKTEQILKAKELQIGIDIIASLFARQFKPGLILIHDSKIDLYQDKEGNFKIPGVANNFADSKKQRSVLQDIKEWLFEQSSISLSDIKLTWYLPDDKIIILDKLHLKLSNGVLQHNLQVAGELKQDKNFAKFNGDFKFRNDILENPASTISGQLKLKDCSYTFIEGDSNNKLLLPFSGDIKLLIEKSRITLDLFRQPMEINQLSGRFIWQIAQDGLKFNINNLRFSDNWLSFKGSGKLFFAKDHNETISDIRLKFKLRNLNKAKLYYPAALLPTNATVWLDQAFTNSSLISGDMVLQGPLSKFPFDQGEGKFIVDSTIRDVDLQYDAEWPIVEKITGKMVFSGRNMTITSSDAKIMGAPVKFIRAVISDLDLPILCINGEISTDSQKGLEFVNSSPLKVKVGKKLQDIQLTGPLKLDLDMEMPLSNSLVDQETKLQGDIYLNDNLLNSAAWGIQAKHITGNLRFKNDALQAKDIQGELFDNPIKFSINTIGLDQKDTITRVNIAGAISVDDLQGSLADKLLPYLKGKLNYQAILDLHSEAVTNILKVESNLNGLSIILPKPFGKDSTDKTKLVATYSFGSNKFSHLYAKYTNKVSMDLLLKRRDNNLNFIAGELRFGSIPAKTTATKGLLISGKLDELDWLVWKKYLTDFQSDFSDDRSIIRKIGLSITKLNIFNQVFRNVSLKMIPSKRGWSMNLNMPNIKGNIYFPQNSNEKIVGNFSKLVFEVDKKDSVLGLVDVDLKKIPPLKITIHNLFYGKNTFKKVLIETEPKNNGIKFNDFKGVGEGFDIEGNGEWLKSTHGQRTTLRGTITSEDVGALLKKWDLTDAMVDGKGGANFTLNWSNSLYQLTLSNLTGSVFVYISNGRIINLDKSTENKLGFGRILGLLSLQSIPRRLTLDFSDFIQQGFGFDTIEGNLKLNGNQINLEKILVDGPVAHIKAHGVVGIKDKSYDIMLSAAPKITSSIPLIATIAGGPPAGIISFIAEKIVSSAIKKTAAYNYHITGNWNKSDSKVDKIK